MDPSTENPYTYMPVGEVLERWHDGTRNRKSNQSRWDIRLGIVIDGVTPKKKLTPKTQRFHRSN